MVDIVCFSAGESLVVEEGGSLSSSVSSSSSAGPGAGDQMTDSLSTVSWDTSDWGEAGHQGEDAQCDSQ